MTAEMGQCPLSGPPQFVTAGSLNSCYASIVQCFPIGREALYNGRIARNQAASSHKLRVAHSTGVAHFSSLYGSSVNLQTTQRCAHLLLHCGSMAIIRESIRSPLAGTICSNLQRFDSDARTCICHKTRIRVIVATCR